MHVYQWFYVVCYVHAIALFQPAFKHYADALHPLMRANISPGSLIYFPLFHVDNFTQRLQTPAATCRLFAVCLFGLPGPWFDNRQIFAIHCVRMGR
ncbi:hypothetical protein EAG21025_08310 [Enterobacter asburiae]|jgi:hypothetical protein